MTYNDYDIFIACMFACYVVDILFLEIFKNAWDCD